MSGEYSLRETFPAGAIIFHEGQAGDCAYIIEKGLIGLSALINDQEVEITQAGAGDIIGEMVLIDDGLRSATATVLEDAELLVVTRSYLQRLFEQTDSTIELLLKITLERYRSVRNQLEIVSRGGQLKGSLDREMFEQPELKHQAELTAKRLDQERDLKEALDQRDLQLFYQPIVDLKLGKIIGCEALIRWIHPEKGMIPPVDFIGLAEQSGLIEPIGYWIFDEARAALADFKSVQAPGDSFFVSVNLSSRQVETDEQVKRLHDYLLERDADLSSIKIEITESLLMSKPLKIAQVLAEFKQYGAQIALDDFGTGYSSFSYLHRFPIDNIKIDQSFVSTMRSNPKSEAIVRTLCTLAHSLDMTTIAEGVEELEDQQLLKQLSSDYGQGYLYSRPVPREQFIELLQSKPLY